LEDDYWDRFLVAVDTAICPVSNSEFSSKLLIPAKPAQASQLTPRTYLPEQVRNFSPNANLEQRSQVEGNDSAEKTESTLPGRIL
jgi:hypothetical protein